MINYEGKTCKELGISVPAVQAYEEDIRFYDIRKVPEFRIYGLNRSDDDSRYVRIPEKYANVTNESLMRENSRTSGGRIRFVTDSDYIAVKMYGMMSRIQPQCSGTTASGIDLYMKRAARSVHVGTATPALSHKGEFFTLIEKRFPKGRKEITLNCPMFNQFTDCYIGLDKNSTLETHPDYTFEKPVLFYGSSITHGGNASRPGLSYPAIISRRYDTNFINLGLSGNCKAEDSIIEYLCTLDPSVFVLDYDHNAPTAEHLEATHEKLYLAFRAAHPTTPVVIVTMPNGNDDISTNRRRSIIFRTYKNARERGEKVIFVDGTQLFGADGHDDCTTDGCHPNDIGMMRMADHIGKAVEFALAW